LNRDEAKQAKEDLNKVNCLNMRFPYDAMRRAIFRQLSIEFISQLPVEKREQIYEFIEGIPYEYMTNVKDVHTKLIEMFTDVFMGRRYYTAKLDILREIQFIVMGYRKW
jgi:hypothetical protein